LETRSAAAAVQAMCTEVEERAHGARYTSESFLKTTVFSPCEASVGTKEEGWMAAIFETAGDQSFLPQPLSGEDC
jgi:hypothetical protein